MHTSSFKTAVRAAHDERGMTLVEFMVSMVMAVIVAGAATYLLIIAVQTQPRISDRAYAIQQARVLEERLTRELRASYRVDPAPASPASAITFGTYLRRVACGGAVPSDDRAGIPCQVSYSCNAGTCVRSERNPDGTGTPDVQQLVTGLSSSSVFFLSPSPSAPTYVRVQLEFPAQGGEDAITLSDGV